ncbi:MAG TPA: polysaccharide deacetylase family protein [Pirellulales bacterium]|nr:polysaccharide deacetylase family protein [Pirellulales bacterium]
MTLLPTLKGRNCESPDASPAPAFGQPTLSRRRFLGGAAALAASAASSMLRAETPERKAQIAITLDLEMSREYPRRGMTEWDYEKGNLDEPTKRYAVEAAEIVKQAGGRIHFFCVARVLEQPDVEWLKKLSADGHPIGNHTYDHVYVRAKTPEETQFRFRRAPWLVAGKTAAEIIDENIRLASQALKQRAGIDAAGFRTPGGFHDGLENSPDVQRMLLAQGFTWVSSKYPAHENELDGEAPSAGTMESILAAQRLAQPFVYPSGLVEVPMSPISDVGAFRNGHWKLKDFCRAVQMGIEWAIETGSVFDFLAHPSCLVVEDPKFETIRLICRLARDAGVRAELSDLGQIAKCVMKHKK